MTSDQLWAPTSESISQSNIGRFVAWLGARGIGPFESYDALWQWSIDDIAGFWAAVWEFFEVQASVPYTRDRRLADDAGRTLVDRRATELRRAHPASRRRHDRRSSPTRRPGRPSALTWNELVEQVGGHAPGCSGSAFAHGDRVAAYLPNIPETIVAFLATAQPRRDLDVVRARVRRAGRARPIRARSSRRCCSPSRATATAAATIVARDEVASDPRRLSRACGRRSSCRTPTPSAAAAGAIAPGSELVAEPGALEFEPGRRPTIRSTCCTRRARPGCRSRSCTATAASCSSISRCSGCTPTSGRPTASSGSPRPAG